MLKFIFKRLLTSIITIFLIVTFTFILMHIIPGDPFTKDKGLPDEIKKNLMDKYHLNDPLWKQYGFFLKGIIKGDLGLSLKYPGVTVNKIIADSFPISAQLGLVTISIILLIGIPAGIISALRQNKWQDHLAMFLATLGVAIPNFVVATLLMYIFGVKLGWLPTSRWVSWKSVIMPSIALASYFTAYIARLTRSSILEIIQHDYIHTAKSKGLPERIVVYKHALRNAIIPIITYMGPLTADILTGSFVIEKIFAIPGLGQYFIISIGNRDYTIILGLTIFYASLLIILNMIVDILYGFIDPRIRIEK